MTSMVTAESIARLIRTLNTDLDMPNDNGSATKLDASGGKLLTCEVLLSANKFH